MDLKRRESRDRRGQRNWQKFVFCHNSSFNQFNRLNKDKRKYFTSQKIFYGNYYTLEDSYIGLFYSIPGTH